VPARLVDRQEKQINTNMTPGINIELKNSGNHWWIKVFGGNRRLLERIAEATGQPLKAGQGRNPAHVDINLKAPKGEKA
jgi:hypothetical protein